MARMVDNWEDLTLNGKTFEFEASGGNLLMSTDELPQSEQIYKHLGYTRVRISPILVVGAHPAVLVVTPNSPRKVAAVGMKVVEVPELPQLRVVVNKQRKNGQFTRHYSAQLSKCPGPWPTLCGATIKRATPRQLVFEYHMQVWQLGRTEGSCASCKQVVRRLFGVADERFHAIITQQGLGAATCEADAALARMAVFFQDDTTNRHADITVLDEAQASWPSDASKLSFATNSFFAADV